MKEEKIIITINDMGETMIEVAGVKGKACLDLTRKLEQALGIVTKRESKREMTEYPVTIKTSKKQTINRN